MRFVRWGLLTVAATATAVAFGCGKKSSKTAPSGPPGSPDGGFGTVGSVLTPAGFDGGVLTDLFVQKDGKIAVVGGYTDAGSPVRLAAARYRADGSLDPTFGTGGVAVETLPPDAEVYDAFFGRAAMQADGKILVAGSTTTASRFSLARIDADGTMDAGFGDGGLLQLAMKGPYGDAHAVAVQPDGKIVVAGFVEGTYGSLVAVARLDQTGAFDPSFGTGGFTVLPHADPMGLIDMALQSDGKILLAGFDVSPSDDRAPSITRLDASGALDPTFGAGGYLLGPYDQRQWWAVKTDSLDRIVTAGIRVSSTSSLQTAVAARFSADGAPDPAFGDGGTIELENGDGEQYYDLAIDPADDVVIGGQRCTPIVCAGIVTRVLASGAVDANFGTSGTIELHPGGAQYSSMVQAVAVDARGRILAGGGADVQGFEWSISRLWP